MAENGSKVHENPFQKAKEHIRHGAHRVAHFRHPGEAPVSTGAASHAGPPSISEGAPVVPGGSYHAEDYPYASSRDDMFTTEVS